MSRDIWGWLKTRRKRRELALNNKRLQGAIREQQKKHAKLAEHYEHLKAHSSRVLGKITDIKYIDLDDLAKNRYAAEPADMIFWIRFEFENGNAETLQYYQRPHEQQNPEQRHMLEFSGDPNILDYCAIGSKVYGYFQDGRLVALDNIAAPPPKT